jgi:hypothetical protein
MVAVGLANPAVAQAAEENMSSREFLKKAEFINIEQLLLNKEEESDPSASSGQGNGSTGGDSENGGSTNSGSSDNTGGSDTGGSTGGDNGGDGGDGLDQD